MEEKTSNRILSIHNSDLFGIFVESGCAGIFAGALQSVEGASKTVYMAESPYSKEYQHLVYKNGDVRSIGKESAILFANKWIREWSLGDHKGINFIYTSSFQIAAVGSGKSTHGWIAHVDLKTMKRRIFHVSLPTWSREETLGVITNIGLDILEDNNRYPYVDIMEESTLVASRVGTFTFDNKEDQTIKLLKDIVDRNETETPYICLSKRKAVRAESIMRGLDNIVVYKGSFNPAHNVHVSFAKMVEGIFKVKPILSISMDTFGKNVIFADEVLERAYSLNDLGFDVIILKDALFSSLHRLLHKKFESVPKIFMAGSDTFNRLITSTHTTLDEFEKAFANTKFVVLDRPGSPLVPEADPFKKHMLILDGLTDLSSTMIRGLIENNEMEEVSKLVPEIIYKNIKK
jgi:nicotinic acid mononucleotide adenylyltransferase